VYHPFASLVKFRRACSPQLPVRRGRRGCRSCIRHLDGGDRRSDKVAIPLRGRGYGLVCCSERGKGMKRETERGPRARAFPRTDLYWLPCASVRCSILKRRTDAQGASTALAAYPARVCNVCQCGLTASRDRATGTGECACSRDSLRGAQADPGLAGLGRPPSYLWVSSVRTSGWAKRPGQSPSTLPGHPVNRRSGQRALQSQPRRVP